MTATKTLVLIALISMISCNLTGFKFLEDSPLALAETKPSYKKAYELVKGFMVGSDIERHTEILKCIDFDGKIAEGIMEMVETIKSIGKGSDIVDVFEHLSQHLLIIAEGLNDRKPFCLDVKKKVITFKDKLAALVTDEKYYKDVISSAVRILLSIEDLMKTFKEAVKDQDFLRIGEEVGTVIRSVFYDRLR